MATLLPSTRAAHASSNTEELSEKVERRRIRCLRSKLRYFDFRVTARSRRVDGSDDTLHMQAPSPAKHESGRGVPLPHGTDGLNRCRAGTAQHLASQPRQKVPKPLDSERGNRWNYRWLKGFEFFLANP